MYNIQINICHTNIVHKCTNIQYYKYSLQILVYKYRYPYPHVVQLLNPKFING